MKEIQQLATYCLPKTTATVVILLDLAVEKSAAKFRRLSMLTGIGSMIYTKIMHIIIIHRWKINTFFTIEVKFLEFSINFSPEDFLHNTDYISHVKLENKQKI